MKSPLAAGDVLARNTLLHLVGQALPLAIGVVAVPVVVRGMGPSRFGLLSLAWAMMGYFTVFDLGLGRAATKLVAEALSGARHATIPSIVWSAVIVQGALGVIGATCVAAASGPLVQHVLKMPPDLMGEARLSLIILACACPVFLIMGSLRGVLEASQRFDLVNIIRAPFLACYFLMPLVGLLLHLRVPSIVALLVLCSLGALVGYWVMCARLHPEMRVRPSLHRQQLRALVGFGSWISVSSVVAPALVQLDRFVIGAILSLTAVGYYSAPYEMVTRLWIVPTSFAATLFPAFSALGAARERDQAKQLLQRSVRHMLLLLGPIVAVLIPFAHDVVQLLFGGAYAAASTRALQILAVGVLVNSLAWTPTALIQAFGRPDVTAKFHLLEVPIHFTVMWFLVRAFGITGAALAWSIRVTLDAILLFVAVRRLTRPRTALVAADRVVRTVGFVALVGVCAWLVSTFLEPRWVQLLALALLGVGIVGATWSYMLDDSERRHLMPLVRLAGRLGRSS